MRRILMLSFLLMSPAFLTAQINLTVNTALCFKDMDNNATYDEDAVPGQITLTSLVIQGGGSISYNDPGNACSNPGVPNNGAQPVAIIVSGSVDIQAGGSINTENKIQAGAGGNITLTIGGAFTMRGPSGGQPGALISSSNLSATSGDMWAGDITIHVDGDVTMEPGSVIKANSYKGKGGEIEITSGTSAHIDGLVSSESTGTGTGTNQGHGGTVTIVAGASLLISDDGIVRSKGLDPGADLVHLCACNVIIYGLVESTGPGHGIPSNPPNHLGPPYRPDKPSNSTAGVEIWAGSTIVIDNLNHNGVINANTAMGGGTSGFGWIDIFAVSNITIIGATDPAVQYAVHANQGPITNGHGGWVTVKSTEGSITTSGRALQASSEGSGGKGGIITVEAGGPSSPSGDVSFGAASIQAKGANGGGGGQKGGEIRARSFSGKVTGSAGGELNAKGGSNAANFGKVILQGCGDPLVPNDGVAYFGNIEYDNDAAADPPTILGDACGGTPTLPSYVLFCPCDCYGSITIIKVLLGADPGTPWEYVSNIPGHANFALPSTGGSVTFNNILPGVYTVTEVTKPGYNVTATCNTNPLIPESGTLTMTGCEELSCTFRNVDPGYCSWCSKGAVLSQVQQNMGDHCAMPDIIVDLRLPSTTVDPTKVGTTVPATGSLQAAIDYMNYNDLTDGINDGDFNGDGKLFIGVIATDCEQTTTICSNTSRPPAGDTPYGTENVIVTNVHAGRMNIFGCSVTIHAANPNLPVMTIRNSVGKVTVLDIHVKYSNVEGYKIEQNGDLVVVKNSRAMFCDRGYYVTGSDVQITGAPQISNNRVGIQIDGSGVILRTNSDIRDNSQYGILITGGGNETNNNEVGVNGHPNGTGILVTGNSNDMHDDNVSFNSGDGIVVNGNANSLDGEDAENNGGNGITVGGNSNVITDNRHVADNGGHGIAVTGDNNTLEGNTASDNGGNGIVADEANGANGNKLKKNKSNNDNGLHGIRACGQIDQGDNTGSGNGAWPDVVFVCSSGPPKFYVADASDDQVYLYAANGAALSRFNLDGNNGDASGVFADASSVYVVDKSDKQIYQYDLAGNYLGASKVLKEIGGGSLSSPGGMAIDGNELWVADGSRKKVYRYSFSGAFPSGGNINASQEFAFIGNNGGADGLVVDATYCYVLDNSDKQFYRYVRTTGAAGPSPFASRYLRETGGGGLSSPSGAMLDGSDVWVVDRNKDKMYRYSLAALFTGSGNQNASSQFALHPDNSDAQMKSAAEEPATPATPHLLGTYPNPFTSSMTFRFLITTNDMPVSLGIFDQAGRKVASVFERLVLQSGVYNIPWSIGNYRGEPMESGTYIYRLQIGDKVEAGRMILMK